MMKEVLFVCVHNSGRSQMAEAFFNRHACGKAWAFSAGTKPASHTDRTVAQAMREVGLDISDQFPKILTPEMLNRADKIITLDRVYPTTRASIEDWRIEDPEGKPLEEVRKIRDEIMTKVERLLEEMKHEHAVPTGAA